VLAKAEIATMVRAANGWPPVEPPRGIFADVPVGHWAAPHVEAFFEHAPTSSCGIDAASGKPLFCPANPVPRWHMAMLLVSLLGL
jgi:hypothetical protein